MSAASRALEDRGPGQESSMLADAAPRSDRLTVGLALGFAAAFHVAALLLIDLPDAPSLLPTTEPVSESPVIVDIPLTPPRIERPVRPPATHQTRRLPVPDSTTLELEPLLEEVAPQKPEDPLTYRSDDLAFVPSPPPTSRAPMPAGFGGVTNPTLLWRTEPVYPELARRADLEGDVALQAVVQSDGSVGEIRVLRCSRPGVGFEEAAIDAVSRWRYSPALQDGRAVDVLMTVYVTFEIE